MFSFNFTNQPSAAWLYSFVSIVFFVIGFFLLVDNFHFMMTANESTGVITHYETHRDDKGEIMYTPIIEYTPLSFQKKTFRPIDSSSFKPYKEGEKVIVLISDDGEDVKVKSFFDLFFVGAVFFALSLFLPVVAFRSRKE